MLSSDGGLPISAAIAFSSWPRWIATAIARARVLSTVVRACATSAAETRPALYWFWVIRSDSAVGFHGRIEQPAQLVEYPDCHIGRRQLRLRREARRGKIGGAGLRRRYGTGHIQPNTPPQIGDPAGRPGGAERVTYLARSIRDAGPGAARNSGARARRRRIHVHCWKKTGARRGNRFRRVAKRRLGRRHVLVRDLDLAHQRVEHRIAEHRPPRAAVERVGRARLAPALLPFVRGRHRRGRPDVFRADRARGQDQANRQPKNPGPSEPVQSDSGIYAGTGQIIPGRRRSRFPSRADDRPRPHRRSRKTRRGAAGRRGRS